MSKEIRQVLISRILSSEGVFEGKYSNSFNIIKGIIRLEEKEEKNKLPLEYFERFIDIEKRTTKLSESLEGFPLRVIEEYFFRNRNKLDKYLYLIYKDLEVTEEIKTIDLYELLEQFFQEVYLLALEIGDYYSLEIKLKKVGKSDIEDFL